MKKLIKGILLVIPMMLLVACGGDAKLSEKFNEEEVKSAAQTVITSLDANDFEKVYEISNDKLKEVLNEEKLKETFEPINEKIGAYKETTKTALKGGEGIATVVAIAQYENGKVQYTISFDEEMKLSGLYVK